MKDRISRHRLLFPLLAVTLLMASVGCGMSRYHRIGPRVEAHPEGCEVEIFESEAPNYAIQDLAEIRADCMLGRDRCLAVMRRDACRVGGDTVYAFEEERRDGFLIITAKLARRIGPADPVTMPEPEPEAVSMPEPEPVEEAPVTEEPAVEEPAVEEPTADEPADEEPTTDEPTDEEPATDEPAEEEPAEEEPAEEEPAA